MDHLELKLPPLLLVVVVAAAMSTADIWIPQWRVALPLLAWVSISLLVLGLGVVISGVLAFRSHQTTVDPTRPEKSSGLVTSGIYTVTRNPMYLGFLLVLMAWGWWLGNLSSMPLIGLFVCYLNRFQIQVEEKVLSQLFSEEFEQYRTKVRRWL